MLATFDTYLAFLMEKNNFSIETPIYIDSNLGSESKGEEIAHKIYAFGFKTIYLATGYCPSRFQVLPYIKGVTNKMPPWEYDFAMYDSNHRII